MGKYDKTIPSEYDNLIREEAAKNGLDYEFFRKLIWTESRFNKDAQSPTGPRGIAQFTKATAKNMGLIVNDYVDERLDPVKSISASARHLGELYKKSGDDYSLTALMYNQGEGKLGRPQIEAYKRGDSSGISKEGLKYIEGITGKTFSSGQGITPKAAPTEFEDVNLIGKSQGKQVEPFTIEDSTVGVKPNQFKQPTDNYFLYEDGKFDKNIFEGTGQAIESSIKNSFMGQAYQAFSGGEGYTPITFALNTFNPRMFTKEEEEYIKSNLANPAYLDVINNAKNMEDVKRLVEQANKNYNEDLKISDTGVGAQLIGGVSQAVADPFTLVPIFGATSKAVGAFGIAKQAFKVGLQAGTINVASEALRTQVVGGDTDYSTAMIGGFVLGSGVQALAGSYRNFKNIDYNNEAILTRIRSRAEADANNLPDTSKANYEDFGEAKLDSNGQAYKDIPQEEGSVILEDGTIVSSMNPINPNIHKKIKEADDIATKYKAYSGIKIGGLTDISTMVSTSDNPEILGISKLFVKPVTGAKNVYAGMTISDILSKTKADDNIRFESIEPLFKKVTNVQQAIATNLTEREAQRLVTRKIAERMESGKQSSVLSPQEEELMRNVQDFFKFKEYDLMRPSKFGNPDAKPILETSRYTEGNYFPNRYDRYLLQENTRKFSHIDGGLQAVVAKAFVESTGDPKVYQRAVEDLTRQGKIAEGASQVEIQKAIEEDAWNTAYGITKSNEFVASSTVDEQLGGLVGVENNDYIRARHPYDSSHKIEIKDKEGNLVQFSVNDLRNFDLIPLLTNYANRINGDVAIMGATGKTTKELKDEIVSIKQRAHKVGDSKTVQEADALEQAMLLATGRTRRTNEGLFASGVRTLNNLTLWEKGGNISLLNLGEAAGMIAMNNLGFLARSIPYLNKFIDPKQILDKEEIASLNRTIFGKEISDAFRPDRASIIERLQEKTTSKVGANIMGSLEYGAQELTARSFWIKWIPQTTNLIIDTARQGFIGDLVDDIMGGASKGKWDKPEIRKAAGITDEQYEGMKQLLKDHSKIDVDGKIRFSNLEEMKNDPRMYDLWRYGDYLSKEAIIMSHRLELQSSKNYGPMVKLALFFKSFVMKSLNGRTVSNWHQATKNNRALEKAFEVFISMASATALYGATTKMRSYTMSEEDREAYMERAFSKEVLMYNAVTRSSSIAGIGLINYFLGIFGYDPATTVRSTLDVRPTKKEPLYDKGMTSKEVMSNLGANMIEQVPAANLVSNLASTAVNATNLVTSERYVDEANNAKALRKNLVDFIPNVPVVQAAMISIMESLGVIEEE